MPASVEDRYLAIRSEEISVHTNAEKGHTKECTNYRTIALISHASKILLKVIHDRLESHIDREMSDTQAGFRKKRGTRDQIANLRWIMERQREYNQDMVVVYAVVYAS